MLKLERIKDYLLLEEEFIKNQERLKPQEEKQEVMHFSLLILTLIYPSSQIQGIVMFKNFNNQALFTQWIHTVWRDHW